MEYNGKIFIDGLQVLRFFAALMVVLLHYFYVGPTSGKYELNTTSFSNFFFYGYLGVTIFFCISGFIICEVSTRLNAWQFAIKRATRIMPGFIMCVIISSLVIWHLEQDVILEPLKILSNVTLVPQIFGYKYVDGVYWSLLYEVIFYGWVFILIALGVFYQYLKTLSAIWLFISLINLLLLDSLILECLFLTTHSGAFMIGICIWICMKEKSFSIINAGLLFFSVISTALGLQQFGVFALPDGTVTPTPAFLKTLPIGIGVGLLVYLSIFAKIASRYRSLVLVLGGTSYPLYLLHQEIGYAILGNLNFSIEIISILLVSATIIIVSALLYFVESKLIRSARDLFS